MASFKVTLSAAIDSQPAFGTPLVRRLETVQHLDETLTLAVPATPDEAPTAFLPSTISETDSRVLYISSSENLSLWIELTDYYIVDPDAPGSYIQATPIRIVDINAGGLLIIEDATLITDRLRWRNEGAQSADIRLFVGGN